MNFPDWISSFVWLFVILGIWEAVWKAIALWRAARNSHLAWFVCIFIFNTVGILSIIYIFGFSKKKVSASEIETKSSSGVI
jgi:hypothetical protein